MIENHTPFSPYLLVIIQIFPKYLRNNKTWKRLIKPQLSLHLNSLYLQSVYVRPTFFKIQHNLKSTSFLCFIILNHSDPDFLASPFCIKINLKILTI